MTITVDAFLAHHGVRGQKWGIRNLREQHNEKQARQEDIKVDNINKQISQLAVQRDALSSGFRKGRLNKKIQDLSQEKKKHLDNSIAQRKGDLTKAQKKLVIGSAVAGGIVAAVGTYKMAQSGELHSLAVRGKAAVGGDKALIWKKKPELAASNMSAADIMKNVVKPINPNYGSRGTVNNCRRSTYAYEMRRRGFNVAATRTDTGRGQDPSGLYNVLHPGEKNLVNPGAGGMATRVVSEAIKKAKEEARGKTVAAPFTDFSTKTPLGEITVPINKNFGITPSGRIFKELAKHPNGARGELGIVYHGGGAHSVAWEIINHKPHIIDAQVSKKFTTPASFSKFYGTVAHAGITRLDNKALNNDFLLRWLKSAA